jgi:hypothetical protein
MKVGFTLLAFLAVGMVADSSAYAAERDMGKISQADLRKACNNVGGDLLGVSDSGSYGCEDNTSGNMILCNTVHASAYSFRPCQRPESF